MRNFLLDERAELALTTYDNWWLSLSVSARRMIRRSRRLGVEARVVNPDEVFWVGVSRIYAETPQRRGRYFKPYGRTPDEAKERFDRYPDNIFIGAYFEGELIAFMGLTHGVVLGFMAEDCMNFTAFQGYMKHFDKAPMNALVDVAVKYACSLGVKRLVYTRMRRDGLGVFKRSVGFRGVKFLRGPWELVDTTYRHLSAPITHYLWHRQWTKVIEANKRKKM